jgi:mono/diheme cytochrome c family protein
MIKIILTSALIISASSFAASPEGEYVARISDCVACHTKEGGDVMAGGKRFHTPLGDIFSTNITPDVKEGIGLYSYPDFEKAVRKGVARDGHYLYPAMPYPSYAKMNDEDMHALYTYFKQDVKASAQKNSPGEIPWIFSPRWPLGIWNWMFTDSNEEVKIPAGVDDGVIQRGKYLVEGPGHCGACHTPRGIGMQEKSYDSSDATFLSGAMIDGWYAPSLRNGAIPAEEIKDLLKTGRSKHSAISGPMSDVVTQSTQYLNNNDLNAISSYLVSLSGKKPASHTHAAASQTRGAIAAGGSGQTLYLSYCSTCHGTTGQGTDDNAPSLVNNPSVSAEEPDNLIKVIAFGAETPVTQGNIPFKMPAYHGLLQPQQMRDIVNYVRGEWGNSPHPVDEDNIKDVLNADKQ